MQGVSKQQVRVDRHNRDALPPKEGSDLFITAFSDASWHPTTKAYGVGVWIKSKEGLVRHGFGGVIAKSSEAEKAGLLFIVETLQSLDLTGRIVVIQCDNLGELNKLDVSPLKARGAKHVKLKHVRGHTSHQTARTSVNAWCDKRAYEERKLVEQGLRA